MKSVTSKLAIIILSLLASTHTFAFNQEEVCAAMNYAVTHVDAGSTSTPTFWGPITNIFSRKTSSLDSAGEVIGNVGGLSARLEGQSGLDCSGETCHVNKKWDDCECTSSKCTNEATARSNAAVVAQCDKKYEVLNAITGACDRLQKGK